MVCSNERDSKKYPFDIQHRTTIPYTIDAPGDFDNLKDKIAERIKALLERGATLRQIAATEQVAPVGGLSQPEITVLAVLAGKVVVPAGTASVWSVQQDAERASLTTIGFTLGIRRLTAKPLVQATTFTDQNDCDVDALRVTDAGWDWIDANEERFVLRRLSKAELIALNAEIGDDDIPF